MYAFLFAVGAAITAAGLALVASGVSIQDRAFDANNVTPGVIAIIGGCILIGLAFVVRALLRVERALMAKPMPRAARPVEISAELSEERADEPRIPLPTQAKTAGEGTTWAAASQKAPVQASSDKPANADRIERSPVVDAGDVSLMPNPPPSSDEDSDVANPGPAKLNGSANGASAPSHVPGGPTRQPPPKHSIFDTLWPKAPRLSPETEPKPATQPAPVAAAPLVQTAEPAPRAAPTPSPAETAAAVSILKSGVVEGMAYTLYSDGSIEAQLPGGTLRFRSITELRSHIEQNG